MFDRNIITHVNSLEHVMDYTFSHLGFSSKIEMPLVFMEPLANPTYCRQQTQELFFECYDLEAVCYTNDNLAGYYYNTPSMRDGLIISSGHSASHIIPIIGGTWSPIYTKRIPIGGLSHFELLTKSIQLKYPQHRLTPENILEIQHEHTYCALNYREQIEYLQGLYDEDRKVEKENDKKRDDIFMGRNRIK